MSNATIRKVQAMRSQRFHEPAQFGFTLQQIVQFRHLVHGDQPQNVVADGPIGAPWQMGNRLDQFDLLSFSLARRLFSSALSVSTKA